ncbi:MAG: protein kinase [Proteobacteria bacterium]|nr:protein kinase [Pseudomonadota bacterium]
MQPGTVVAGRYVIEALAGSGGMASVYKARDQREGCTVAFKVLQVRSEHLDQRFARESKLLHELHHPAIVRYLDSGVTDREQRFLVMEWLDGEDLSSRVSRQPLTITETLILAERITSALTFLHSMRIVHRDVKPANIFLSNGEVAEAKLLDFGIARWAAHTPTLTQPGTRNGTPAYMSPEQVRCVRHLNPRTDVFSLGCVLYECLTGNPAFAAKEAMAVFSRILVEQPPALRELVPAVPGPLDALIGRMLAKQPHNRPTSSVVATAIRQLGALYHDEHASPRPLTLPGRSALSDSEQRLVHVVLAMATGLSDSVGDPSGLWLEAYRPRSGPASCASGMAGRETLHDSALHLSPKPSVGHVAPARDARKNGAFDAPGSCASPGPVPYGPQLDGVGDPQTVPLGPDAVRSDGAEAVGRSPTLLAAGSVEYAVPAAWLQHIARQLRPFAATCHALGDGSIVAVVDSGVAGRTIANATAADLTANAARCALRLREELPGALLAISSGNGIVGENQLVGRVFDRAVKLLSKAEGSPSPIGSQPNPIRIDKLTASLLGPRFEMADATRQGLLLYDERHASVQTLARSDTLFVGRNRELKRLTAILDECVEDRSAHRVLVIGPPGSGKSRLCREFLASVAKREDEVTICLAQPDSPQADSPFHLMAQAVRSLLGIVPDQPASVSRRIVRDRVTRHVAARDADRVAAFLGELIVPTSPPIRSQPDPPGQSQLVPGPPNWSPEYVQLEAARRNADLMSEQLRRACIELLDAETRNRPMLLVVDDLHWVDRASLELLDCALRTLAERPLMLLAFGRSDTGDDNSQFSGDYGITNMRLGRLSRRAADRMVRTMLGDEAPDERVAALVEHADGNPFYLEELARAAAAGHNDTPETAIAMRLVQIHKLHPNARQVLRAASVFGESFWSGGVAELLDDRATTVHWLRKLTDKGLIIASPSSHFSDEQEYRFAHCLTREAAYSTLTDADRHLGRRLAQGWLQRMSELCDTGSPA